MVNTVISIRILLLNIYHRWPSPSIRAADILREEIKTYFLELLLISFSLLRKWEKRCGDLLKCGNMQKQAYSNIRERDSSTQNSTKSRFLVIFKLSLSVKMIPLCFNTLEANLMTDSVEHATFTVHLV